jgi:hypothetical protein
MSENLSELFQSVLDIEPLARVRRNHGLEHATLNMLSRRFPRKSMAGHSNLSGFWILGDISTEDLQSAVDEALERLQNGERNLAVHPNCGTNFVTTGVLAGLAGGLAMFGAGKRVRDKLERLPLAMVLATLTLILTQPLGSLVQERVTTSGDPGGLSVVEIVPTQRGRLKAHRVVTQG